MRLPLMWVLAMCASLASAAFPAAPNCATGAPMLGSWHTVESAEDVPMDKLASALKQKLAEAPYKEFWSCAEANAAVNLEQACTQGAGGGGLQQCMARLARLRGDAPEPAACGPGPAYLVLCYLWAVQQPHIPALNAIQTVPPHRACPCSRGGPERAGEQAAPL